MTPLFGWTPLLAVDVETTSRSTRHGEIVELAAWRVVEGGGSQRLFDTLVRPFGPLSATEKHGITNEAVANAPRMSALVPHLESALANRVLVTHNALSVLRHLEEAFRRAGRPWTAPRHVCTMQMARALGLSGQMSLSQACQQLGVALPAPPHQADRDARAIADLFEALQAYAAQMGVHTVDDLAARARFHRLAPSFTAGMLAPLWPAPPRLETRATSPLCPRHAHGTTAPPRSPRAQYQAAVLEALAGLDVAEVSLSYLDALRQKLGLSPQAAAYIHALVLQSAEARYREDHHLDATEASHLERLRNAVAQIEASQVEEVSVASVSG
jgi:DNA polymerase-3 subunit epsilon